jgi:hypothetical protein
MFLKQSTAATVKIGPFLDDTDGKTAEASLVIGQADIRLTKAGGAFGQTNNAAGATHDENGYYGIPLDTTDTNTVGRLKVAVSKAGALPVWQDFFVVPANVYDSLVGSDKLDVNTAELGGVVQTGRDVGAGVILANAAHGGGAATITANITGSLSGSVSSVEGNIGGDVVGNVRGSVASVGTGGITADSIAANAIGASELAADAATEIANAVAAGLGTGTGFTAIPWNAAWDAEVESECTDALNSYDPPTKAEQDAAVSAIRGADSDDLKALSDQIDALVVAAPVTIQTESINLTS